MLRDVEVWLWDELKAAEAIEDFMGKAQADEFAANDFLMSAVERKFEIIGEALNNYSKVDPEGATNIAGLSEIVAFRNRIIHGYRHLDPHRVCQIAKSKLPRLKLQLSAALAGLVP